MIIITNYACFMRSINLYIATMILLNLIDCLICYT